MKILHTADIHLGTNTYGRIDPETGLNTRLLDFKRCFDFMVERGLEEDIDVFLFCGDAYRTADPTPTQQKVFAECLKPISDAGIPIIMITGNHDHPVSYGKASAIDIFQYVTGRVHLFRKPDTALIETKSGPLQLLAMPWPVRSMLLSRDEHRKKSPAEVRDFIEQKYVEFIETAAASFDPSLPTILAGHFSVAGGELSGSERTSLIAHEPKFTPGQLSPPPIDYVALGHIHRYQDLRPDNEAPPVVYCSSIERISFKEWNDRKGFVLVTIEAEDGRKHTSYEFVETPARRFVSIAVDARDTDHPTEAILEAIAREEIDEAIVRVRYHIDEVQVPLVDVQQIRAALKTAYVVASVERTVDPVERQRRTVVTRESTLEEAMKQYVAQHEHLASIADDLLKTALELEHEYETRRRSDT